MQMIHFVFMMCLYAQERELKKRVQRLEWKNKILYETQTKQNQKINLTFGFLGGNFLGYVIGNKFTVPKNA